MSRPAVLGVVLALSFSIGCAKAKRVSVDQQKQQASSAKAQLFASLSSRLQSVASKDGFGAAISVCASEAPNLAAAIASRNAVRIGRTSAQLRNPANTAPAWASRALEKRPSEATFVELEKGTLGALYPIRLKKMCENCHGDPAGLAEPVRTALAKLYPSDRATGYSEGDLRGWFWVEVPANH